MRYFTVQVAGSINFSLTNWLIQMTITMVRIAGRLTASPRRKIWTTVSGRLAGDRELEAVSGVSFGIRFCTSLVRQIAAPCCIP